MLRDRLWLVTEASFSTSWIVPQLYITIIIRGLSQRTSSLLRIYDSAIVSVCAPATGLVLSTVFNLLLLLITNGIRADIMVPEMAARTAYVIVPALLYTGVPLTRANPAPPFMRPNIRNKRPYQT